MPRGTGIVTRRPLILQLEHSSRQPPIREHGRFLNDALDRYDFNDIRQQIQIQTDQGPSSGKNISPVPINLKIISPSVLNLTLVDLPGVTKIALKGQPEDIEVQIRSIVMSFIRPETCLILAVTPANSGNFYAAPKVYFSFHLNRYCEFGCAAIGSSGGSTGIAYDWRVDQIGFNG